VLPEWVINVVNLVVGTVLGGIVTYVVQRHTRTEERKRVLLDTLIAELEYNKRLLKCGIDLSLEFKFGYRGQTLIRRIKKMHKPSSSVLSRIVEEGLLIYLKKGLKDDILNLYQKLHQYSMYLELLNELDKYYEEYCESTDFRQKYEEFRESVDQLRQELIEIIEGILNRIG